MQCSAVHFIPQPALIPGHTVALYEYRNILYTTIQKVYSTNCTYAQYTIDCKLVRKAILFLLFLFLSTSSKIEGVQTQFQKF